MTKQIYLLEKILKILKSIRNLAEIGFLLMILANIWVYSETNGRTYNRISKIPPREIALVLGTSPKMKSGVSNPYFVSRMDAAALLYHHGKIKQILVSGEKSKGYDEPAAMTNYLIYQEGVPESAIIQDGKGFNTRLSINNCKKKYKKNNIIIVSQGFHNLRALFYARNLKMNALAFDARDVYQNQSYYRNQFREFLARVSAVIYYLLGVELK